MKTKASILLSSTVLVLISCSLHVQKTVDHKIMVDAVSDGGFTNLYKVNDNLYRSEQPSKEGMLVVQNMGICTIINLRHPETDKNKTRDTSLKLIHLPINTWFISHNDVLKALVLIKTSEKPVLVHCKHGSDRTGCIIAAYRMVFDNWSREDAIKEFKDEKFGYHQTWFPNILNLLSALDVEKLKVELGD